jgi:hypothetical protein
VWRAYQRQIGAVLGYIRNTSAVYLRHQRLDADYRAVLMPSGSYKLSRFGSIGSVRTEGEAISIFRGLQQRQSVVAVFLLYRENTVTAGITDRDSFSADRSGQGGIGDSRMDENADGRGMYGGFSITG